MMGTSSSNTQVFRTDVDSFLSLTLNFEDWVRTSSSHLKNYIQMVQITNIV